MATIRKLRGRWQAQVRRRGMKPRCKSFDTKTDAEKWARELESQVDRFGAAPDIQHQSAFIIQKLINLRQISLRLLQSRQIQKYE